MMTRARALVFVGLASALAACGSVPAVVRQTGETAPGPAGEHGAGPRFAAASPMQCAPYARGASGIAIFGDAHTWWAQADGRFPRSSLPSIGAVIAIRTFQDGARGHVAVVRRIVSDRVILVDHANWHGREEVTLSAPVRDVSPAGDWSQVNVWWLDTNSWGAKTYAVDGFIHPH